MRLPLIAMKTTLFFALSAVCLVTRALAQPAITQQPQAQTTVVVSGAEGSVTSQLALLSVVFPTSIIDPPLSQFAWVGQPVTLRVSFTSGALAGTSLIRHPWPDGQGSALADGSGFQPS